MSQPQTLQQWIDYIQTLHHREIELSLDRVASVLRRLYPQGVQFRTISIAGTNGKGSTAALLASICQAAGVSVGKYTSPHLISFNERYQINGRDVDDTALLQSFERVEAARADTLLTFFEFGTLLAIDLFSLAGIEVAVLEVGLGGRLDAVNIIDADVSIVTSLSIDHSSWLGDTLEQIGREKIGIARSSRPCVIGVKEPPDSVLEYCRQQNVKLVRIERDFGWQLQGDGDQWQWRTDDQVIDKLPLPFGQAGCQLDNAAVAVQAIYELAEFPITAAVIRHGVESAELAARRQIVGREPLIVVDVAHNVDSVTQLAEFVQTLDYSGRLIAVCGMLADKQIEESLRCITEQVDEWHLSGIAHERGASSNELAEHLLAAQDLSGIETHNIDIHCHDGVVAAYDAAYRNVGANDCLLVFGSFFLVGDIIGRIRATANP